VTSRCRALLALTFLPFYRDNSPSKFSGVQTHHASHQAELHFRSQRTSRGLARRHGRAGGRPTSRHAFHGDVHRQYPWLAFNLYKAFAKAKEIAQEKLSESIPAGLIFGAEYLKTTRKIFGADPFPYGVKANREMLQTIIDYSHEQGLTPEKLKIEDLFAPSTLDV
jgi:hypothetical protein